MDTMDDIPSAGGWEVVDTGKWDLDRVNDLMSPYTRDITDVLAWEGRRNGAPIKSLYALEKNEKYWNLYRENWFKNIPDLEVNKPTKSREEIIDIALEWQKNNPVNEAFDPLNPPEDKCKGQKGSQNSALSW